MTVGLLAKRKRLNEISGSFCIRPKCDLRNLEADVAPCVNGATGMEFFMQNIILS